MRVVWLIFLLCGLLCVFSGISFSVVLVCFFFFVKQKTAYEMRISDWSSDVCSSDLGAIMPWNVPLLLMALKIAPAILAGNAVVVKSAEEAPLTVLRVCQIMNSVLPAGVLNMLSGYGPECGAPLVSHPKVGKVTFTGSVETGKIVYKTAAYKLIPVTLELGGKSPMIVFADANVDKAVDGAVIGMRFTRQGQSCTAASRIFVHRSEEHKTE